MSVQALFDFDGEKPNDLSFKEGDIMEVNMKSVEQSWWSAHNLRTNRRGNIPRSYVVWIQNGPKKDSWWFNVDRKEANGLLSQLHIEDGTFLVRRCATPTKAGARYVLSVRLTRGGEIHIAHYQIILEDHGLFYISERKKFIDLSEMIDYYRVHEDMKVRLTLPYSTEFFTKNTSIPLEIEAMDESSIELFKKALEKGVYRSFHIRVMIVGHFGVGKTTLTKKLLGEDIDQSAKDSTDGVEIYTGKCRDEEDQTWQKTVHDEGFELADMLRSHGLLEDIQKGIKIQRLSDQPQKAEDTSSCNVNDKQDEFSSQVATENTNPKKEKLSIAAKLFSNMKKRVFRKARGKHRNKEHMDTEAETIEETYFTEELEPDYEDLSKDQPCYDAKTLLQEIVDKKEMSEETRISLEVWDFGGQGNFYATHQSLFSYRSIYLLVFDISKSLDDFVEDEDLDPAERKRSTVKEFLSFWIGSIKTYAAGNDKGFPRILVVGTHVDCIQEHERKQTIQEYTKIIKDLFEEDVRSGQLVVDNSLMFGFDESNDIKVLQNAILKIAKKQPFWGEELPKSWIPLQHHLSVLRKNDTKVVSFSDILKVGNLLPVRLGSEDVNLCLCFQHSIGSAIFYPQKGLSDHVILEPKWLVTTLRSLITCECFCTAEVRKTAYKMLKEQGVISTKAVESIWKLDEFSSLFPYKDHLLKIMERLDLIARPKVYEDGTIVDSDMYFIPSMAKDLPPQEWSKEIITSKRVLPVELDFSESFLSPAVLYRLISSCISVWPVHRSKLYFGCCLLTLDPSHRLLIMKKGDKICLYFEHRRTSHAINKFLMKGAVDIIVDILNHIVNLYPRVKTSTPFTVQGRYLEVDYIPEHVDDCRAWCLGMGDHILDNTPNDLELMRFAKCWDGAKDNLFFVATQLRLQPREISQIEHDYKDDLVLKTFYVLQKWQQKTGKASSFRELIDETSCNTHILCKILRETDDRAHQSIPTERLEETCTDEMIDKMSIFVGMDFIHFGLELGLKLMDIENVKNSNDTRGLFDINRKILTLVRDSKRSGGLSIRLLTCALLRIGNVKAFDDFYDQFIAKRETDEW